MLALLDWFVDPIISSGGTFVFDPASMIQVQGPIRTSVYRDELGQNTGIIIRDKFAMTTKDKLRIANGGHIITSDSDGNLKVFCKKMYHKKGRSKWKVSHRFYATVTDDSITMIACAVCARFVKVREQYIDYQWGGHNHALAVASPSWMNIGVREE
jgi:hypothetical protein